MQETSQQPAAVPSEEAPPAAPLPGVAEAVASMPEPQEHAIEEAQRQSAEAQAADAAKVDQFGTPFDPAIHTGSLTTSGRWRMKKGAAPSRVGSARSVAPANPAQPAAPQVDTNAAMIAQANAAGAAAAESIIVICRAIGGDDFNPIKTATEDERAGLHDAWAQYFIATGKTFSPGWLLLAANGGYIARRMTMPKTQTRLQSFKEKLYGWIAKRRARKNANTAHTSELDISAGK